MSAKDRAKVRPEEVLKLRALCAMGFTREQARGAMREHPNETVRYLVGALTGGAAFRREQEAQQDEDIRELAGAEHYCEHIEAMSGKHVARLVREPVGTFTKLLERLEKTERPDGAREEAIETVRAPSPPCLAHPQLLALGTRHTRDQVVAVLVSCEWNAELAAATLLDVPP